MINQPIPASAPVMPEMVGGIETGLGLGLVVGEGSLDTTRGDHHNRALSVTHTRMLALLPTLLPPTPSTSSLLR